MTWCWHGMMIHDPFRYSCHWYRYNITHQGTSSVLTAVLWCQWITAPLPAPDIESYILHILVPWSLIKVSFLSEKVKICPSQLCCQTQGEIKVWVTVIRMSQWCNPSLWVNNCDVAGVYENNTCCPIGQWCCWCAWGGHISSYRTAMLLLCMRTACIVL